MSSILRSIVWGVLDMGTTLSVLTPKYLYLVRSGYVRRMSYCLRDGAVRLMTMTHPTGLRASHIQEQTVLSRCLVKQSYDWDYCCQKL
jgi:hypothetical protein